MKKLLKYGVASLSLATLSVVATATDLPVLGAQVVHAEDAASTVRYFVELNVYENGVFFDSFSHGRRTSPPTEEEYYRDFPNVERVIIEKNEDLSTSELPHYVVSVYRVIPDEGTNPKDTDTDPVDNGNADTGGGDNAGVDTSTPPTDNSGDTGSQDQTPPANNNGGDTGDTDTTTPPADTPKPQTLTVVETRQDENGVVLFTKTHSLVLNPGEEKDLGYNPDREVLVRGGNLYRYGNFEDGATLYFTTRLKPVAADKVTPAPTTTEATVTPAPPAPAAPSASADQVATTRNQLLAQVDQSRLTDEQKGELAVKIAFAETAEELNKLKAELTSLTAPASKPASADKPATADNPAPSAAKTLPTTGELSTETLTAMGLSLVLFSLGLAKARKTK